MIDLLNGEEKSVAAQNVIMASKVMILGILGIINPITSKLDTNLITRWGQ